MHRNDTSKFFLYIEPNKEEKLKIPIEDDITKLMELALSKADIGISNYSDLKNDEIFDIDDGWMGWHTTDCGYKDFDSHDYLLENGLITNSLAAFYIKWYRNSIHENDWLKLIELGKYYGVKIDKLETYPTTKPITVKDRNSDKKIEDMMIDELSRNINNHIIEKIKSL